MSLTITKCNGNLGAEVSGVDLTVDLDDATIVAIEDALVDSMRSRSRRSAGTPCGRRCTRPTTR